MKKSSQIEQIRSIAKAEMANLLNGIRDDYKEKLACWLPSESEEKRLIDLVVLNYLDCWLETAQDVKQTLNSYETERFLLRSEQKRQSGGTSLSYTDTEQLERIRRTIEPKVNAAHDAQIIQANKEKRAFKDAPEKTGSGRFYDYVTLLFFQLLDKEKFQTSSLRLYELLVEKKEVLRTTAEKSQTLRYMMHTKNMRRFSIQ